MKQKRILDIITAKYINLQQQKQKYVDVNT